MELEEAKEVIKRMDVHFLERRAERLIETEDMRNLSEIPEEIQSMLYEGCQCFIYLKNSACVILTSASLELALKMKLFEVEADCSTETFNKLIKKAEDLELLNSNESIKAHEIRGFRNVYAHSNREKIMESAECIEVNLHDPLDLDIDEEDKNHMVRLFQLMEIKYMHARFCLLNSYVLIRKLYPLSEDIE